MRLGNPRPFELDACFAWSQLHWNANIHLFIVAVVHFCRKVHRGSDGGAYRWEALRCTSYFHHNDVCQQAHWKLMCWPFFCIRDALADQFHWTPSPPRILPFMFGELVRRSLTCHARSHHMAAASDDQNRIYQLGCSIRITTYTPRAKQGATKLVPTTSLQPPLAHRPNKFIEHPCAARPVYNPCRRQAAQNTFVVLLPAYDASAPSKQNHPMHLRRRTENTSGRRFMQQRNSSPMQSDISQHLASEIIKPQHAKHCLHRPPLASEFIEVGLQSCRWRSNSTELNRLPLVITFAYIEQIH